jgi:fructose-1,6-bisphosphatase/inositol monophosphatase family enzyme
MAYAAVGGGAWYVKGSAGPQPARVSKKSLAEGLFLTSEVKNFHKIGRYEVFDQLQQGARISRTWGDAYGYLLLAVGRAEVMIDPVMNVWDCAALQPVIEEAGGTFTDWQGVPTIYSGNALATNGATFDDVLRITRK